MELGFSRISSPIHTHDFSQIPDIPALQKNPSFHGYHGIQYQGIQEYLLYIHLFTTGRNHRWEGK